MKLMPYFYICIWRQDSKKPCCDFIYWGWHTCKEQAYKKAFEGMDNLPKKLKYKWVGFYETRISLWQFITSSIPNVNIYFKNFGIEK